MKRMLARSLSWSVGFVSTTALVVAGLASCSPVERDFGSTGGSGGGGGGGGGSEMVCVPDTQEVCYSGPEGSLEVGMCKAGLRVCLQDGSGFGECGGEVVPQPENCLTPDDEACNGNDAAECPPLGNGWFKTFGSPTFTQIISDVAITPSGEIVTVGAFADTIDFGNGPMAATGGSDIFIAKFDTFGNLLWSNRFGDASIQYATSVAVDQSGAIYVGGGMLGSVDFGNGVTESVITDSLENAFLVKFDPDGTAAWAHTFGDNARQVIRRIEISKLNFIVVAGEFAGTISFDLPGATFTTTGGSDIFVARFDTSGFASSARAFGGMFADNVRGMALDSQDRVIITGGFDDKLVFGMDSLATSGGTDAYVACLTPALAPLWARSFGNPNQSTNLQEGYDVAVGSADEIYVSGGFVEAIDIAGSLYFTPETTSRSMFIARMDNTGFVQSAAPFGGVGGAVSEARLAFDANTNLLAIAGAFTGTMTLGGDPLVAEGGADPFLAKLDPNFTHLASRSLPTALTVIDALNTFTSLALLSTGDLIVGGVHRSPMLLDKVSVGEPDPKDGNAMLGRFIP